MPKEKSQAVRSIKQQIRRLLLTVSFTMAVIIAVLSFMLVAINSQYARALSCANTAADFNKELRRLKQKAATKKNPDKALISRPE